MSNGWINYTPGDPLPDKFARIEVQFRDGFHDEGATDSFDWEEAGEWTITQYRVIEPDVEWIE